MNYLGCSLVHFNANAIVALSSFVMLCECWLGIPSDSCLFWYYYSPSRYTKFIYVRMQGVYSGTLQGLLEEFTEEMVPY
jgi:hypothetical protein